MVIIYDGDKLAEVVLKVSQPELTILQSQARPRPEEAIVYIEKEMDVSIIKEFPPSWAVELEKFDEKYLADFPERIFTRDFKRPKLLGKIYVQGSFKGLNSLCNYLLRKTRLSFGISGDVHRLEKLEELSGGRIKKYINQPLNISLGPGQPEERHLYIWDGSLEELYRLRQTYEELPRYHYILQWGFLGKSFHNQRIIHGRYLGRISRWGFGFEWKRIIKILANQSMGS